MTYHIENLLHCNNLRKIFPENIEENRVWGTNYNSDNPNSEFVCDLNNCYCYLCFAVGNYFIGRNAIQFCRRMFKPENFSDYIKKNDPKNLLSSCNKILNRLMIIFVLTKNGTNSDRVSNCIEYLKKELLELNNSGGLYWFNSSIPGDDKSLFDNNDIEVLKQLFIANGSGTNLYIFYRENYEFWVLIKLIKNIGENYSRVDNLSEIKINNPKKFHRYVSPLTYLSFDNFNNGDVPKMFLYNRPVKTILFEVIRCEPTVGGVVEFNLQEETPTT